MSKPTDENFRARIASEQQPTSTQISDSRDLRYSVSNQGQRRFNRIRVAILLAGVLTSILAVAWLQSNVSAVAEVPQYSLEDFPKQIGDWVGEDVSVQKATVEVLDAHSYINRLYRDRSGRSVYLHIAIWTNEVNLTPAPHHPDVCYRAAGWQILSRQSTTLPNAVDEAPLEFISFRKQGLAVVTGHWYQMGDSKYTHSGNLFSQRLHYFGAQSWPYSIKILMQVDAPNIETVQPMLEDFTELVGEELNALNSRQATPTPRDGNAHSQDA